MKQALPGGDQGRINILRSKMSKPKLRVNTHFQSTSNLCTQQNDVTGHAVQLFEGNFKLVESPETECALSSTDCCSPLQKSSALSTW